MIEICDAVPSILTQTIISDPLVRTDSGTSIIFKLAVSQNLRATILKMIQVQAMVNSNSVVLVESTRGEERGSVAILSDDANEMIKGGEIERIDDV